MAKSAQETGRGRRANPNRVQSLDRGLQLLEALSRAGEPLSLGELAELIQVDRSTAHRLLGTLLQRGFVRQEAHTRHYSLGPMVVALGRQVLQGLSLRTAARNYLRALARESGETANLVLLVDRQLMCVDLEPSPAILSVTNEIGTVFPAHATAAGKAVLACLPEAGRLALLGPAPLAARTRRSLTDPARLEAELDTVRRQGYALDDEESHPGVRCVAAPVRSRQGEVIAALSLSGPTVRLTPERLAELALLVRKAADGISADLRGTPD